MNDIVKILVVEDDDDQWESYEDAAEDLSTADRKIKLERKASADEAKSILLSNRFDGAIVDLNLNQGNPDEASGNEVLNEIMESHRFPVLVVSGNLQHLDNEIREKESVFLKFFERDTPNNDIFNHLLEVHTTGITKILGGRGRIEKLLGEIFWKHLSNDFKTWFQNGEDSEKPLLRYTVSHLGEYLDIPDGENDFYHEAEVYIKPPIREFIATGDIIKYDSNHYIVLSPSCDIAVRKIEDLPIINANQITLSPLIKIDRNSFIENSIIKEGDNSGTRTKILEKIIKGQSEKYSFIPAYSDIGPFIIDFQNLSTIAFTEFQDNAERISTITGVFLKDIQSSFSSYLARQGQPDLNKKELIKSYKKLLSPEQN